MRSLIRLNEAENNYDMIKHEKLIVLKIDGY